MIIYSIDYHMIHSLKKTLLEDLNKSFPHIGWKNLITTVPSHQKGHIAFPLFKHLSEYSAILDFLKKNYHVLDLKPFINIIFSVDQILTCKNTYPSESKTLLIEYSQPNTHKVLHIGHMRNLSYGHSLSLILKEIGFNVITCTYPGDHGAHVAKCLWYYKKFGQQPSELKGEYLGSLYSEATTYLENHPECLEEVSEVQKEILSIHSDWYQIWVETRKWSLQLMEDVYNYFNVSFDRWYFESEEELPSLEYANDLYTQGFLELSEGAIGKNLKDEKLGFALLLKKDGNSLYLTKDLVLAKKKHLEFQPDENIYIVDARQEYHFKQLFSLLDKLNEPKTKHLKYEVVELDSGAMSSRKGNFLGLWSFLKGLESKVLKLYLDRYSWSEEEKHLCAKQIVVGAIKYGMLKVNPLKKVIFNEDQWLSLEGNTGVYLQYTGTRIKSILRKNIELQATQYQYNELEVDLLWISSLLEEEVFSCSLQSDPSILCHYLYNLCKKFNQYYASSIIQEEIKRIDLAKRVLSVLNKGLELLGIEIPERM